MPLNLLRHKDRTEEIQDIIERMPSRFGVIVSAIVLTLISIMLLFGWLIKYPDSVVGDITINSRFSAVKLIANSSGKITLLKFRPKDRVKENDYLAIIQNPSNTADVLKIKALINGLQINQPDINKYLSFPKKVSLGESNEKYYTFLNDFEQLYQYKTKNIFLEQEENIQTDIAKLNIVLQNSILLKATHEKNMKITRKFSHRDSILLSEKLATEDELDQSTINYLTSAESYHNIINNITNTQQQITDNESKLAQLIIQKKDKERQIQLDLLGAYNDLKDNLDLWEQHYVLKSPMNGKVEFLKFMSTNQFIQSGEEIFTIVPVENKLIGQVYLPAAGAGKVKTGQEVIVKLENYPYEEYGSIKGRVSTISMVTNKMKSANQTEVENYLVEVELPKALMTNYGKKLEFKYGIKGTVEIINNDRRLIERFFDNLKYNSAR